MADPFLAEIRMIGFSFAPKGWATCDGQILPISQNTALFSIVGTTYGGNGINIFALPDLRDRVPVCAGSAPGLTQRFMGDTGGEAAVTLTLNNLFPHSHPLNASTAAGLSNDPAGKVLASPMAQDNLYAAQPGPFNVTPLANALASTGGGQPHNNLQPFLKVKFVISLTGLWPPRP